MVENEDHPVLRPHPVEAAPDRVGIDDVVVCRPGAKVRRRFGLERHIARMNGRDRHLAPAEPLPAGHQRGVGNDPVEPAVERRRIAQARELSPRCQERILGCVGRVGVVGQD